MLAPAAAAAYAAERCSLPRRRGLMTTEASFDVGMAISVSERLVKGDGEAAESCGDAGRGGM